MSGDEFKRSIALFPWGDVVEEFLEPIGLDANGFAERMTGGWLFGYVAALQSAGWRPIVVCASEGVKTATTLTHEGTRAPIWMVPGTRVAKGRSPAAHSLRCWLATPMHAFRRVIEQENCRTLLIQEYEYTRFDALVRLAKNLGIPSFATFQGGNQTLSWLEGLVRGHSLSACAGLVIASAAERSRVTEAYVARHPPIAAIPNPVDADEWKAVDRREARHFLGLPQDAFIAINHGRIDIHRKGHDVLLRAWANCSGDELVLIGSGQDHDEFASLLAASCLRNVRWLSAYMTDRLLIRRWLSAADVYVSASRLEGMPVAPLEAMACGLPIIATDAQGMPDILTMGEASGGLLVSRDDAAALTAAIERLRADPELRVRLGHAARHCIEQRFSVAVVGRALASFLDGETGIGMGVLDQGSNLQE